MRHSVSKKMIPWYIRTYGVDTAPIQRPLDEFENMLAFFTRTLQPTARPICPEADTLICPVDGTITMAGDITETGEFLVKKNLYTFAELTGGDQQDVGLDSEKFLGGCFAVLHLSPKDYHRVHVPLDGMIRRVIHIPGALRPVKIRRVERFPRVLVSNERVVIDLETRWGPAMVILVGATNVGSIRLTSLSHWTTNHRAKGIRSESCAIPVRKGEELGYFEMGSTVVLCLPAQFGSWTLPMDSGTSVQMGQTLARMASPVTPEVE